MSTTPNEQTPNPDEQKPEGSPETPSAEDPKEDEQSPDEAKPEMTLEDALSEVTKTRGEAANYRTRLREAEAKLAQAKSLDEVNEIVRNLTVEREAAERALLVENVALKYDLPEPLAKRLQGATREELEADAKALADLAGTFEPEIRLRGGLKPDENGGTETTDPGALAKKYAPRR